MASPTYIKAKHYTIIREEYFKYESEFIFKSLNRENSFSKLFTRHRNLSSGALVSLTQEQGSKSEAKPLRLGRLRLEKFFSAKVREV